MNQGKKSCKCFILIAQSLSSSSKRDELELYIKQNKLDIVAITETWAAENIWETELNIDDYVTYGRDRHEIRKVRGGGVIIYVSNGLSSCFYGKTKSPAK